MAITITYEITRRDYAEANSVVVRRAVRRSKWQMWTFWGAAALLLLLPLAYRGEAADWDYPVLVVPFAAFLAYWGLLFLFPSLNARHWYSHMSLAGRSFTAEFSLDEVKVTGGNIVWIHRWPSFLLIAESPRLFVFYDGIAMYIFAKRYFAQEQISSLQQLVSENWRPSR